MKIRRWAWILSILVLGAFFIGWWLINEKPQESQVLFDCQDGADNDTTTSIIGPETGSRINAGTELRWERAGHDICQGFGTKKRYSVAVCRFSTAGACLPNNGFYNAFVSPTDLGWNVNDPGVYTLSQEHINKIQNSSGLEEGAEVFFQIRYNYTNFSTQYGVWATRAFTLGLDGTPIEAPAPAPTFNPPLGSVTPTGPFTMSWNNIEDADYYKVRLVYRAGSPSGTDFGGDVVGESDGREVTAINAEFDVSLPSHTGLIVWVVAACNAAGCSQNALQGVLVDPPAPSAEVSFSTIAPVFKAPSCVNCHAVVPTNFANQNATNYEDPVSDFFGLPPAHPQVNANDNCVNCHTADQTPGGSHPVPWQVPTGLDLRNKNDSQLCEMAKDPGNLAENIEDHLLGDPLILWAINGGILPQNAGNTDDADGSPDENDWVTKVQNWVDVGASCD